MASNVDAPQQNGSNKSSGVPVGLQVFIALIMIGLYVVGLYILFKTADDQGVDEKLWSRYIYLIGGFEAVVFTAVGWFFGREVNRKQAEQAKEATEDAKKKAAEAKEAKAKGQGLKDAILATQAADGIGPAGAGVGALAALRDQANRTEF